MKISLIASFAGISIILLFSTCGKDRDLLPFSSDVINNSIDLNGIHKTESGVLYISGGNETKGIVYKSDDNGVSWKEQNDVFDKWVNDVWMNDDETGISVDQDVLIYTTTDGAVSWQQYYPEVWPLSVNRHLRDIWQIDTSIYFICGGKNFNKGLIYVTKNNGDDWEFTEFQHELRGIFFNNLQSGIAVGYGVILKTDDQGSSWRVIDSPREFYTGITGDGKSTYWACGFNGGLYHSNNNGENWERIKDPNKAFSSRDRFTCIDRINNGSIIASGFDGIVAISKDNGNSWSFYESFLGNMVNDIKIIAPGSAIAVADNGFVFRLEF
jgi:photosystem II stability/assembly factor-like uncharacterized protein